MAARPENIMPSGPAAQTERNKQNAQRMAEQERNTALARAGLPHAFTSHCAGCMADADHGSKVEDIEAQEYDEELGYRVSAPLPHTAWPEASIEEEENYLAQTYNRRDALREEPEQPGPTDPQLKYIGGLLRSRNLVMETSAILALTKRTASILIDDLKRWKPGMPLWSGIKVQKATTLEGQAAEQGDPPVKEDRPLGNSAMRKTEWQDIPEGLYATPSLSGNNDLDFWRVNYGRAVVFVNRVIGGHQDQQIPADSKERIKTEKNTPKATQFNALEAIRKFGPAESNRIAGIELKFCRRCGIHLTDEESRRNGIGPICEGKE